jgi:hypothetical protein
LGFIRKMAVVTVPGYAPRTYRRRSLLLLVLVFLGLISLAAVVPAKIDCRDELLTGGGAPLTGGGALLTTGRQQCRLVLGEFAVALPAWAQAMAHVLR